LDSVQLVLAGAVFIFGAVIGSFLNVCIYRLPRHVGVWDALKSLSYPPSHCPKCQNPIAWYDNIPLFGWLLLKGRCRNCRLRIPIRYPGIELLTALLFVAVFLCEQPGGYPASSCLDHPLGPVQFSALRSHLLLPLSNDTITWTRFVFHLVLVVALIVATFIDFDLMIIPDSVTRPATIIGLLGNWILGTLYVVPVWYQNPQGLTFAQLYSMYEPTGRAPAWIPTSVWQSLIAVGVPAWIPAHPHLHGLLVSVAGIVVGGLIVWLVRVVGFWALKREAMGDGDIYLLAMIGSFLGWQATAIVFFLAPMCALAVALVMLPFRRDREIPYGPYLSLATLVVMLGFPWIWPRFETGLFSMGPFLPVLALAMVPCLGVMLILARRVLNMLGFESLPDEAYVEEWGSGDQLAYLAAERVDEQQGTWRANEWPGRLASRGQLGEENWLRPNSPSGWQQQWQRRN